MPSGLIKLDQVDVSLGGQPVLADITWELNKGENWVFVGANGSGKSTILKLIRGDIWPCPKSSGTRTYHFEKVPQTHLTNVTERIGLVSAEHQGAYREKGWNIEVDEVIRSGFSNTAWAYQPLSQSQEQTLEEVVETLGIQDLRNQRMLEISQGQARKALIARALTMQPEILILDEFCNGLDTRSRYQLLEFMQKITQNGTQLLYTTHRSEEIIPEISHVVLLKEGTILEQGDRKTVLTEENLACTLGIPLQEEIQPVQKEVSRIVAPEHLKGFVFEVRGADVYLDGIKILHNINWTMNENENWVILGENGSGKSTFLRLLFGDLRPALGGHIRRFDNESDRVSIWETKDQIGYVSADFQAGYDTNTSLKDAVYSGFFSSIGLWRREITPQQKLQAQKWLQFFEIDDLKDRELNQLSYGQRRCVFLARAMVNDPKVLVLDEPCDGLDIRSRNELLQFLEKLSATGVRLLYVTHHQEEIIPSTSHILLMKEGQIQAQGPKESLLENPDLQALFSNETENRDTVIRMNDDYKGRMIESIHWLDRESPALHYYQRFRSFLPDTSPKELKLLDIGCAHGIETNVFSEIGFEVEGLDFNPEFIADAKRRFPHLSFLEGSAEALPHEDETLDICFSINTFFFTDITKSIPEVIRVLKPGGLAVVSFDTKISDLDEDTIVHQFPLEELKRLLSSHGAQIVSSEYKERVDPAPFVHRHHFYELVLQKT